MDEEEREGVRWPRCDVLHSLYIHAVKEVRSPTYSQLLALAESSAQQSIRTQRKAYSSVISRAERSVRAEIIPRWAAGWWLETTKKKKHPHKKQERGCGRGRCGRLLIHRPASSGDHPPGRHAASRSVRPGPPVPRSQPLRTQKGRGEGRKRGMLKK